MITPRPERAPLLARRNAAITDPSKHIASRLWLNGAADQADSGQRKPAAFPPVAAYPRGCAALRAAQAADGIRRPIVADAKRPRQH